MNEHKLPVSVIIVAKNEAHNLQRCLESVKNWTCEIIAVINDCADNTEEVLQSFGAKIYHHDWQGFVIQKNRALNYATQPWVFNIDADEEVTPKMQRDIAGFIHDHDQYVAASFCRKSWFMGKWIKHGDWYPDKVTRLMLKTHGSYQGNYLHEKLVINGKTKNFSSNILHYSVPNLYVFLTKTISFTKAFEIANQQHKKFSYAGTIFRAFWKFFRCYFIKRGFLDGYPGLIIAAQQGYSTFFKYNILLANKFEQVEPILDAEDK